MWRIALLHACRRGTCLCFLSDSTNYGQQCVARILILQHSLQSPRVDWSKASSDLRLVPAGGSLRHVAPKHTLAIAAHGTWNNTRYPRNFRQCKQDIHTYTHTRPICCQIGSRQGLGVDTGVSAASIAPAVQQVTLRYPCRIILRISLSLTSISTRPLLRLLHQSLQPTLAVVGPPSQVRRCLRRRQGKLCSSIRMTSKNDLLNPRSTSGTGSQRTQSGRLMTAGFPRF